MKIEIINTKENPVLYTEYNIINNALVAAWSAKGKANDDAERAVLKDLTGNGHDITLNNFAFNGDSGYGNPEYPDALVFDGVDDYGVCRNMPVLTDYTVVFDYNAISSRADGYKSDIIGKTYLESPSSDIPEEIASFDIKFSNSKMYGSSYSNSTVELPLMQDVIYQTKSSFNGKPITPGNFKDSPIISLGVSNFIGGTIDSATPRGHYANMAIRSAYLFNRSLSEAEIKTFVRKYIDPEYLLPSEVPTPDCYYDFGIGSNDATDRETVKDLSGNGKNAKIYNSAFNEDGSGYKDGALFTDGVDDYVALEAFDNGFSTIFMVCTPSLLGTLLYDQRASYETNYFAVYNLEGSIAYNARNSGGLTYINGVKSNIIVNNLLNKKQCITICNGNVINNDTSSPTISRGLSSDTIAKMAIYKFLGFRNLLTKEQIQAVIKKYNLLDKVDEI